MPTVFNRIHLFIYTISIKSRPRIEASVHDRTQLRTMLPLLVFVSLISLAKSVPLEPGQPGGPWTEEEIDIVREKVNVYRGFRNMKSGGGNNFKSQ